MSFLDLTTTNMTKQLFTTAVAVVLSACAVAQGFRLPSSEAPIVPGAPSEMTVYDREGNKYPLSDLMFSQDKPSQKTTSINSYYDAGIFRLHFDDAGSNTGFDDPVSGPQRVAVAKQVFEDISSLINEAQSPYSSVLPLGSGNSHVEIHVLSSLSNSSNPMLGMAGQFYLTTSPGIVHGSIWQTINTGIDAWYGINAGNIGNTGIYHGLLQVNFGHSFYLGTSVTGIGANEIDLYSVLLHEGLHALGIGSLIAQNGNSKLTNSNPGVYSYYDTWLTDNTGNSIITQSGCYSASFNSASLSKLTTSCSLKFNGTNPLFISSDATWSNGTSLSHFPAACGNTGTFSMNPSIGPAVVKRYPDLKEVTALCNLGYNTSGSYPGANYPSGAACGTRVAGTNDFQSYNSAGNGTAFQTAANTAFSCTGNDLLGNDEGATLFSCLEVVNQSGSILGSNSGGASATVTFVPASNFAGTAILKYIPKESATGKSGNITYVFINVLPPPLPPCAQNNPCEMICYGGFEEYTSQAQYDIYTYGGYTTSNATCFNFYPATYPDNSPDLRIGSAIQGDIVACGQSGVSISAHTGNQFVGMILRNTPSTGTNNPEGPALPLNGVVYPGETVTVSFWARLASSACNGGMEVRLISMAPCMNGSLLSSCPGLVQTPVVASGALANNITWQQKTVSITNNTGSPMTHLVLNSLPYTSYTAIPFGFIFLDDVSCIKTVPVFTVTNSGAQSACIGDTVTYTMTITNNANTVALNVVLKDSLSQGLSYVSGGSFGYPQQTIASLASGASQSFAIKALVTGTSGSVFNMLNVISGACLSSSSISTATTEINSQSLMITKHLNKENPCKGDTVQLSIDVCNPGADTVQNIGLLTAVPTGYIALPGTGYTITGGNIQWNSFSLYAGTVTTPACSTLTAKLKLGTVNAGICTSIQSGDNVCLNSSANCLQVNFDNCGGQGIGETDQISSLKCYPNPASDVIWFELNSKVKGRLVLYDITGRTLAQQSFGTGRQKIGFPLQQYAAGLYQYKILTGGATVRAGKFLVEK